MTTATAGTPTLEKSAQTRNLILALLAFTITFWAWNLIAPLGVRYSTELGLSATQKSALVAMPVLVGSIGRIPMWSPSSSLITTARLVIASMVTMPTSGTLRIGITRFVPR